ncbi:hypothetical protein I551_5523 [Mycobacterium ulcerans str. Harvey]|uniref:Uncharacterized protein n=1 Tax=Mycobacterium ulcerans str. Harvey TaxID=1299332 RepID=A0ABN0QTA3_MYCUL|nr:hypothetical protein I551_5523 [Mycobacterium ulcerans str. Harvey]
MAVAAARAARAAGLAAPLETAEREVTAGRAGLAARPPLITAKPAKLAA